MADEVDRCRVSFGKIRDRRMNVPSEKVERLPPAGVVEVECCKAGLLQGSLQFPQGSG
jgi:hypothetical protein